MDINYYTIDEHIHRFAVPKWKIEVEWKVSNEEDPLLSDSPLIVE